MLENVRHLTGEFDLRDSDQPVLVRFRDVADPTSAEQVYPNQFAETYGAGASLERATLSITQDPITEKIDQVLPWLANAGDRVGGFRPEMTLAQLLTVQNFKADGD